MEYSVVGENLCMLGITGKDGNMNTWVRNTTFVESEKIGMEMEK